MEQDYRIYQEFLWDIPSFLYKYMELDIIQRLKEITFLCGMDYASKDMYNFSCKINRYDHSVNVSIACHGGAVTYEIEGYCVTVERVSADNDKEYIIRGLWSHSNFKHNSGTSTVTFTCQATEEYTEASGTFTWTYQGQPEDDTPSGTPKRPPLPEEYLWFLFNNPDTYYDIPNNTHWDPVSEHFVMDSDPDFGWNPKTNKWESIEEEPQPL